MGYGRPHCYVLSFFLTPYSGMLYTTDGVLYHYNYLELTNMAAVSYQVPR